MTTHVYDFDAFVARYDLKRDDLDAALKALPAVEPCGPWIAGGAIRRLLRGDPLDSDVDFFFANEAQLLAFDASMKERGYSVTWRSKHAATYTAKVGKGEIKVQAISLAFYENPAAILDSFDFTICQFAYDGTSLHVGEFALWDLGRSRLSVHKITYAAASVRRMLKYQTQRYTICQGAVKALLDAVVADPSIIHEEVQYVD